MLHIINVQCFTLMYVFNRVSVHKSLISLHIILHVMLLKITLGLQLHLTGHFRTRQVLQKRIHTNEFKLTSNLSVPMNTVNFDEDASLIALITCPVSAKEIWCRQVNTPESVRLY